MPQLVLYQPDIAQNFGALLRLSACLGLPLHVIEPCGFPLDDKRIRRAGMDYVDLAIWHRHNSWNAFERYRASSGGALSLMTTKSSIPYTSHTFSDDEFLLFGRESTGVPEAIHQSADHRLTIPMAGEARSLNLAMSAAIVAGEAVRQSRASS